MKWDAATQRHVPAHDLTRASVFGNLKLMLEGNTVGLAVQQLIPTFREKLKNFCDDDYLLPTGDPVAMGVAIAVAAEMNNGRVCVLRWDRETRSYIEGELDFEGSSYYC